MRSNDRSPYGGAGRFPVLLAVLVLGLLEGCAARYAFVMMTGDREVKSCTVVDTLHAITYRYDASYRVGDVVTSRIVLEIVNGGRKELSLGNGRIRITSRNVDYEMNGRFIPLPDIIVGPHSETTLTFTGTGRRRVEEPWRQIAGEQMTVTLRGLLLGGREIPGHEVRFVPVNPKL